MDLMDWFGSNAISLLWMIVVVVTAFVIYGSAVTVATGLATGLVPHHSKFDG
jgi:hypothetical protein